MQNVYYTDQFEVHLQFEQSQLSEELNSLPLTQLCV